MMTQIVGKDMLRWKSETMGDPSLSGLPDAPPLIKGL